MVFFIFRPEGGREPRKGAQMPAAVEQVHLRTNIKRTKLVSYGEATGEYIR